MGLAKDWAWDWASVPGELEWDWAWAREELELVWLPVESALEWGLDCCDLLSRKRRAGRRLKELKELERWRQVENAYVKALFPLGGEQAC